MRFAAAYYAYGFWLVIAMVLFFIWSEKRRKTALRVFADPGLLEKITYSASRKKRLIKYAMLATFAIFGILALMRPQWGYEWQEVKRKGLDIIIAIDTSRSMLAADVKPNRLERSKLAVWDLIKKLSGDRIGLIAFSGTAYLQSPLTVDYGGFLLALNDLNTNTIPRGGTSISSAIQVAMKSFEGSGKKYKILIIITDGEDHEGDALALAGKAKNEGIKIFCVGIGTSSGELIHVTRENGKKTFLKDSSGNIVKSRLNESVLRKIAIETGASYVRSSGADFGLEFIYDEKLSKMEKKDIKAEMAKLYYERFQIPLLFCLLLLVAEYALSDRKKA
ncbi:MAG: VWA domain-containing protein [Omnitrophica bacterium]|nr:VWA domain-containing protein [Candidatus Omnitrophota bacterium]